MAAGELFVTVDGAPRATPLRRGDGFGELALLAGVPRTATVTALDDVQLYVLGKDDFLAAVAGHAASSREADRLVRERLHDAAPRATIVP